MLTVNRLWSLFFLRKLMYKSIHHVKKKTIYELNIEQNYLVHLCTLNIPQTVL